MFYCPTAICYERNYNYDSLTKWTQPRRDEASFNTSFVEEFDVLKKFQAFPDVAKTVCETRVLFKCYGWICLRSIESMTLLKQKKNDYERFVLKRRICLCAWKIRVPFCYINQW